MTTLAYSLASKMNFLTRVKIEAPDRRRLVSAALVTVVCCPALAACGSSSSSSSGGAATGGTASNRTSQQVKFAGCMRRNGVPIRDPANGMVSALRAGVPPNTLQAAIAACRQYRVGAAAAISPQDRVKFTQAFVKYATCLRAHGIDIPDPTVGGDNGFGQKVLAAEALPTFPAANKACRRTLPAQLGGTGG
jgi:hypothetical protein